MTKYDKKMTENVSLNVILLVKSPCTDPVSRADALQVSITLMIIALWYRMEFCGIIIEYY